MPCVWYLPCVALSRYLGIDVEEDADLLYIAEWALTAPVPEGWTVHLDTEGHEFFHNAATNQSTYEHPMDEHYRQVWAGVEFPDLGVFAEECVMWRE